MLQLRPSERGRPDDQRPDEPPRSESSWPLDAVADAVVTTDERLRIRSWNTAAAVLHGVVEPAVLGTDLFEAMGATLDAASRRDLTLDLVVHGRWAGTVTARDGDGLPAEVTLSLCLLRGADDGASGIVAVMRPTGAAGAALHQERTVGEEAHREPGLPGAFVLHYQPEVDLNDGRIVACEALLRWHHPGLGLLAPGGFLVDAGSAPRMATLGAWTVFAACRRAARWWAADDPVRVILNLSAPQLDDRELAVRVRRATTVTGVEPGAMGAELSAAMLAADASHATRVAWELADAGLAIGLDDVRDDLDDHLLARLPIQTLKLDRSLTGRIDQDPGRQAVVVSIVASARRLGLLVTAEGVETLSELEVLRSLGCDRAFGFLLVPPRPAAQIEQLFGRPLLPTGFTRF